MTDLRYPIGKFDFQTAADPRERESLISQIEETPARLRDAVRGLTDEQLATPYRPDGWTVRQVVHHVPDSHLNSYVRFRLALTEEEPTIKPYHEDQWANLADARTAPIEVSLALLDALHRRWVMLLRSLTDRDFERTFKHPEMGLVELEKNLALYAWHGRHHVAQITALRERMGWDK
jgi:uncharacterized damage-inducible protein DinB